MVCCLFIGKKFTRQTVLSCSCCVLCMRDTHTPTYIFPCAAAGDKMYLLVFISQLFQELWEELQTIYGFNKRLRKLWIIKGQLENNGRRDTLAMGEFHVLMLKSENLNKLTLERNLTHARELTFSCLWANGNSVGLGRLKDWFQWAAHLTSILDIFVKFFSGGCHLLQHFRYLSSCIQWDFLDMAAVYLSWRVKWVEEMGANVMVLFPTHHLMTSW